MPVLRHGWRCAAIICPLDDAPEQAADAGTAHEVRSARITPAHKALLLAFMAARW